MVRNKMMKTKIIKTTRKQLNRRNGKNMKKTFDAFDELRAKIASGYNYFNTIDSFFLKDTSTHSESMIDENSNDVVNPPSVVLNSTNSWFYKRIEVDPNKPLPYRLNLPEYSSSALQVIPRLNHKRRVSIFTCKSIVNQSDLPKKKTTKNVTRISNVPATYNFTNAAIVASTPISSKPKIGRLNARRRILMSNLHKSKLQTNASESISKETLRVEEIIEISDTEEYEMNAVPQCKMENEPKYIVPLPKTTENRNIQSKSTARRSVFHIAVDSALNSSITELSDIIQIDDSAVDMDTSLGADDNNNNQNNNKNETVKSKMAKNDTTSIQIDEHPSEHLNNDNGGASAMKTTLAMSLKSTTNKMKTPIVMKSGKWRRAVCNLRKSLKYSENSVKNRPFEGISMNRRKSISIRAANESPSNNQATGSRLNIQASDTRSFLDMSEPSRSESARMVVNVSANITSITSNQKAHLLRKCGQTDVLPFEEIYSKSVLKKCRKIGEGVFGEVFLNHIGRSSYVLKIIPIEGTHAINGSQQKRFDEILQEVIMSQELSILRLDNNVHQTAGFVEVLNVRLVQGRYPTHLLDRWKAYDQCNRSDNESPECFGDDQLYVVFELANSGTDLEKYKFKNTNQSYSVFKQVAISLAIAESKFEFEHRDLHWGNILIAKTTRKTMHFVLNGEIITIASHGVKATIIDYTLSRILYKNCCFYQDLSVDPEIFEAIGDYQYDIYRLMKSQTNNQWERFEPFTNLLWIHYVIHKIVDDDGVHYANKTNKFNRIVNDEMNEVKNELLNYHNVIEYVKQRLVNQAEN